MRTLERAKRALDSPNLLLRGINRLYHRRGQMRRYNTAGVDVFERDWDNLLILDGCRYDLFEKTVTLDGELTSVISRGSSTSEFLVGNVDQRELLDTVYVTGNPQFYKHREELDTEFHDVWQIWLEEGWDDRHQTVLPETVVEQVLEAHNTYPNKRLVAHFMQPHYPFIGNGPNPFADIETGMTDDGPNCWDHLIRHEHTAPVEDIWKAYRANLERVLPHVAELLTELDGKTVVTSDHGNMIGERSTPIPNVEWGHPRGIYAPELVKVPWLSVDGPRREVTTEGPVETTVEVTDSVVSDRLRQLGYV